MRKKGFYRVTALGLIMALALGSVGCSLKKQRVAEKNEGDKNPVKFEYSGDETPLTGKLELQIFVGGFGSEWWEYAISEFQKLNPDLEITAHLDANVNAQMKTRWAKDNPPDFVFLDGTNMPHETWMAEGKLMDLADIYENGNVYGTEEKIKDKVREGLVNYYRGTDKVYQMPFALSTYGMWYDENLFQQNGWEMPKNYQELLDFSKQTLADGTYPFIYTGQYSGYLIMGLLLPAVASEALATDDLDYFYDVLNAANEDVFDDPRFVRVMEKLKELADAGCFDQSGLSMNHITSQAAWLKHAAALIPNGLWLESEMRESIPDDFKMRYYPSVLQDADQKTVVIAASNTVGIAANAKNPEAAAAFLRFLYTDDVSKKFVELCYSPCATTVDVSDVETTETTKQMIEMLNSDEITMVAKGDTSWGSVNSTISDSVNRIVSGEYTVEQAIAVVKEATIKKNNE